MKRNVFKAAQLFAAASAGGYEAGWTSLVNLFNTSFPLFEEITVKEISLEEEERENEREEEGRNEREIKKKTRKRKRWVYGEFLVPRLYDICCMKWALMAMKMKKEERMEKKARMPREIPERIWREIRDCTRHDCSAIFYGNGRVRRRFLFRSSSHRNEEKNAEKERTGRRNERGKVEEQEEGEAEEGEVVMDFCSVACSEIFSSNLWRVQQQESNNDNNESGGEGSESELSPLLLRK